MREGTGEREKYRGKRERVGERNGELEIEKERERERREREKKKE